ncbi:MAG: restriction endonuclease subunit R, partial [Patescibacteria group bacterium]|nr:restriction endonuclease subunit R [Patescibacteria group bacterium]
MAPQSVEVDRYSPSDAKIALFRSLFRGRDDVYASRFETRAGKSGYQPACVHQWVRGLCAKPKVKCAECAHRKFLPVTNDVVRRHLLGRDESGRDFVMGLYPMLSDETCFLLAVDFDKASWREDSVSLTATCRMLDVPAILERSRSGNGAHVWIFFDEAVPAALARRLGSHLLTETMDRRPDIGFGSYDRFFPNQDTLPKGGFGNLIALPLQHKAREFGNSLFLDEQLVPYPDPWAFLSVVSRMTRSSVEARVREAERRGRVLGVRMALPDDDDDEAEPWTASPSGREKAPPVAGPLPERLELTLADQLYVAKDALPPELRNRLVRLAAFQNPEFYKAQAMRLPTYGKPRIIACAEDYPRHVGLPRGCLD